ncbi:MAG: GNAT family N-acetyltransferase [Actinomycetota bacterium]|nr:GNAT family N-acetyltransferase [Actinomycetota bacterium]
MSGMAEALSPGWTTHLGVLEHAGATVTPGDGCVVVRCEPLPDFHWGNFLLVTDGDVDDADRWAAEFSAAFPAASWVAIGLTRLPSRVDAWERIGLEVEQDDVLTTNVLPRQAALPDGYTVRALTGPDWAQQVARDVAGNAADGTYEPAGYQRFAESQGRWRQEMAARGVACFFGAFAGADLVSDLGIIRCGRLARYHNVATHPAHRRRGLAAHLLGVAGTWAGDRGCDEWVIVTESTNDAGRVYRRAGFGPDRLMAQAYRPPAR